MTDVMGRCRRSRGDAGRRLYLSLPALEGDDIVLDYMPLWSRNPGIPRLPGIIGRSARQLAPISAD